VITDAEVDKLQGRLAQAPRDRVRIRAVLQAEQGGLARWALVGPAAGSDAIDDDRRGQTGVDLARLKEVGTRITALPDGFHIHKTIGRFLENRRKMIDSAKGSIGRPPSPLPSATLLDDGHPVRLSARIRSAVLLAAPFRFSSTRTPGALRPLKQHSRRPGPLRGRQFHALGRGGARVSNTAIR